MVRRKQRIGAYSPANAERILAAIDTLEQSGLLGMRGHPGPPLPSRDTAFPPLRFRNDSGEEIPAYGCMEITGTVEIAGRSYFKADKPTSDVLTKPVMFNLHNAVPDEGFGIADAGVEVRALCDDTEAATGTRFAPDPSSWQMTEDDGGAFIFVGPEINDDDAGRFLLVGGGGVRLFRFTLTSGFTAGVASATIKQMDGTTVESDNINDTDGIFSSLETDDTGMCLRQNGMYYVIQAPCPV